MIFLDECRFPKYFFMPRTLFIELIMGFQDVGSGELEETEAGEPEDEDEDAVAKPRKVKREKREKPYRPFK